MKHLDPMNEGDILVVKRVHSCGEVDGRLVHTYWARRESDATWFILETPRGSVRAIDPRGDELMIPGEWSRKQSEKASA